MPLFEENQTKTETNQFKDTNNCEFGQEKPTKFNSETKQSGVINMIGQCLPFVPILFEQFTGQKIPQMSGTMAEMQMALTTIQNGLQTVVSNQNQIAQRLVNLETNASQQLTNLTQQFQSLRLTHTKERERKEIAYNNQPENQEENY